MHAIARPLPQAAALALLALTATAGTAQSRPTAAARPGTASPVAWHRAVYDSITRALPRLTKVQASLAALDPDREDVVAHEGDDGTGYTAWCEGDRVRAIRVLDGSEDTAVESRFYFTGDSLVFAFQESNSTHMGPRTERFYFAGRRLVRWLGTGNVPQPVTTPEARTTADQTLREAMRLLTAFQGCRAPVAAGEP
jgi:hypothetical protein